MKLVVITGGIASGKSRVLKTLRELGSVYLRFFDCDAEVAKMMEDPSFQQELVKIFGEQCLTLDVGVDKIWLKQLIFSDESARKKLEALIHPRLQEACAVQIALAREDSRLRGFVMDVPLYFEMGETFEHDLVCLVALSEETQRRRLLDRDSMSPELVESIMGCQMSTAEKIQKSDVVLWNDGSFQSLQMQVKQFYFHVFVHQSAPPMPERPIVAPEDLEEIDLNVLRALPLSELHARAEVFGKRINSGTSKSKLCAELTTQLLKIGHKVYVEGVVEISKSSPQPMLRDAAKSFRPVEDDVVLSQKGLNQYAIRSGNLIRVELRLPKDKEVSLAAQRIISCEGVPVEEFRAGKDFDKLTPLFPKERILLENKTVNSPAMRVLDVITPLGMGQRGLIVAPPRGGKTVLLKTIARSIRANYPAAELLVLLLDERPEEVTDFEETIQAPVYASTFDEPSRRHAQVADIIIERAKRLVEQKQDVIILLDSLTRLARGHNANQSGGRIMSGGLGSNAMERPRKFFGSARNVEEGGSLTIVATCLVDTESRMDEVIFEEFKGTGNMEIRLDRELAERRMYPAINIAQSGTRNDDRLYHPDEMPRVLQLRKQLSILPGWEGLESLLLNISRTQNNVELLLRGLR